MNLRDRLTEIIGGRRLARERADFRQALDTMNEAYQQGPYRMPPHKLVEQLAELDPSTINYFLRQLQSSAIYGLPFSATNEDQRLYQVNESRFQWLYSPLAQWSVNTWTSYGLGEKVSVSCTDEKAQAVWAQTWDQSAVFDDDTIHMLSSSLLVDGDVFLAAFISIVGGTTVFEYLPTDEIREIITLPENKNRAVYYKREYTVNNQSCTIYYPDWHTYFYHPEDMQKVALPEDALVSLSEAMDENNGTAVLVLHIAHNRKDSCSLRGWPILGIAAPYLRAHKEFMENRLTVSRQKAMFVRQSSVDGGSRAVAAVKSKFDSGYSASTNSHVDPNPPAIAGSTLIHNKAVDFKDLPMTTGAGDAKEDNNMFAWMAGIGAGLMPFVFGLDTNRWATSFSMDKTMSVQWAKYQTFWSAQFRKMVELVLYAAETWGGQKYEDKSCEVSIDTLSLVDFPEVVTPISAVLAQVESMTASGTVPVNAAKEIFQSMMYPVLTALGVEGVEDILSDDMLGIVEPEEAAEAMRRVMEAARIGREKRLLAESRET